MKALITLFTLVSLFTVKQETETITINATFDGYEDETYYFTDDEDETYYFQGVEVLDEASKKYDLKDPIYNGKSFKVSYQIQSKLDENKQPYEEYIIVKLQIKE